MSIPTQLTFIGRGRAGQALSSAMGVANLPRDAQPKGWVVLSVPDDAIASTALKFPHRCIHLSGSLHLPDVPSLHPLTSLTGEVTDWKGVPLAVTGRVPVFIIEAFEACGFVPFVLPPEKKALYHAVAVLTSGHAATLWLGAQKLLEEAQLHLPGDGLMPLARSTIENIAQMGASGRTGPFVRRDLSTIKRDAAALPPVWRKLFLDLGDILEHPNSAD